MTKVQFRERVKLEARVKTGTNLDSLIDSLATEIMDDYSMKSRYPELLEIDTEITLVDEQSTYALPDDYQNLLEIRYGIGPTPINYSTLKERGTYINRRHSEGYPRHYLISSAGISVFPYMELRDTDSLLISYYKKPSSLFVDDADEFPLPRIENAILKEVLSRIQRFHGSMPEAQMMKQDAQASFIASES